MWRPRVTAHRTGDAVGSRLAVEHDVQAVAFLLEDGSKIAILVGAGALHAREEVLELAEILAAPVVKTLSGKAVIPDDSPYTTGGHRAARYQADRGADGRDRHAAHGWDELPYTEHLQALGKAKVAQIEADPVGRGRVATDVPVVGDAKLALQGLLPMLKRRTDTSFLDKYTKADGQVAGPDGTRSTTRPGTRSHRSSWSSVLDRAGRR